MGVHAVERMDRVPRFTPAPRPVRPDRRRIPRNDYMLLDSAGVPLGLVAGVQGALWLGPLAPTVYLEREISLPGQRPVM